MLFMNSDLINHSIPHGNFSCWEISSQLQIMTSEHKYTYISQPNPSQTSPWLFKYLYYFQATQKDEFQYRILKSADRRNVKKFVIYVHPKYPASLLLNEIPAMKCPLTVSDTNNYQLHEAMLSILITFIMILDCVVILIQG